MDYSPHPPDYTEYIEKNVIPKILKGYKYACIWAAVFILIPVIAYLFDVEAWLFWIYILFFVGTSVIFRNKYSELKCPNCGKPIFALSITIPKKCYYCSAKFRN